MIISHELRYVYIAVPKTGSSTMNTILTSHFSGEYVDPHHLAVVPIECRNYFVFTVVRNPYCRIKSLWKHARRSRNHRLHPVAVKQTFFQFCLWHADFSLKPTISFQDVELTYWDNDFRPNRYGGREPNQSDFLSCAKLDMVIKLESLEQDFSRLPFASRSGAAKLDFVNVDPDGATVSIDAEIVENTDIARAILAWAWLDLYKYGYEEFEV